MTLDRSNANATAARGLLTITDGEFARLRTLVHTRFGIFLADGKKNLVQGRLNKHLRTAGYASFGEYITELEHDSTVERLLTLVDHISTNHSFFFREGGHFDFLVDTALPELRERGVRPEDLRIWGAGAANGQEAYTTAMVVREYFGASASWRHPPILATDISVSSLQTAEAASYPKEAIAGVPPRYRKYFAKESSGAVRVVDEIRRMVLFRRLNLIQGRYPFKGLFHLIFCRNVMIYFDQPTKNALVARLGRYTVPEGYLFVGHSESLGRQPEGYRYVMPSVYKKWQ